MKASGPESSRRAPSWRRSRRGLLKGGADQRVEEALHGTAAAALGELHGIGRRGGNRTGEREAVVVHLPYSAASAAGTPR